MGLTLLFPSQLYHVFHADEHRSVGDAKGQHRQQEHHDLLACHGRHDGEHCLGYDQREKSQHNGIELAPAGMDIGCDLAERRQQHEVKQYLHQCYDDKSKYDFRRFTLQSSVHNGKQCAETGVDTGIAQKKESFFLHRPRRGHKEQDQVCYKGKKEVQRWRIRRENQHQRSIHQPDHCRYRLTKTGPRKKQRCTDVAERREQEENQLSNRKSHVTLPPHQLKWLKKAVCNGATALRGSGSSVPFFSTAELAVNFLI